MTISLKPLLDAMREASLPGPWAQGVKIARGEGAVFGRQEQKGTIFVRVRAPGQTVAPTVTLYPDDLEWGCDCPSEADPCTHAAAAVIALAQAEGEGRALPPAEAGAQLRYVLKRKDGVLALERFVVKGDGTQEPLRGSLLSPAGSPLHGLEPTREDITLDRMLAAKQHGYFPADRLADVFAALASSSDVRLADRRVKVAIETIGPRAKIIDQGDGVALVIDRDPRVTEMVSGEVALVGDTLHRLAHADITGTRLERLPIRRAFTRPELGRLVTEVIPDLQKKMEVDVQTKRLPRARGGVKPRVSFELFQKPGHTISVMASIVYGDPPEARVEHGKLIQLSKSAPVRDEAAEHDLVVRLRDELHLAAGRVTDFSGGDAVRFSARLSAWDGGGERAGKSLVERGLLVPRLTTAGDSFELTFELRTEGGEAGAPRTVDAASVVRAWKDGLPLVPLLGGGFAPLPKDWLARFGAKVADLLLARRDDGTIGKAVIPALAELCDALEHPRPASFDKLAPLLEGFASIPEVPLPADLTATLRHYQRRGVDWLSFLRDAGLGAVLADDMGLGKTLQTLCALKGRTLVVSPRSVVHNWAAEIARFRPGLRVATYHGPKRALDRAADVTLTTYAIMRLDAELLEQEAWDVLVLDEAQAIKNPDSQVARAAFGMNAAFRVALSGTPVENRLDELWSLFHFTNRGLLGGRSAFDERFARPIAGGEPQVAASLRKKIGPFLLRRMKREVAPELPPRTDAVLYVELEDDERDLYDAVRAATQKDVVERLAQGGSVLAALEALLRLRQAACHPSLLPGQKTAVTSSKVESLLEALTDAAADGHKALVFSQWTSFLDLIEPRLREEGIAWTRLDGSTRDRGAVVDAFQSESGPPVMLVSLKAGGTGLNLTAADHVFLLDPWWNPAVEDQAADRTHRIGQDKPVMVYRLVSKDTVEERILALQEKKRGLADAALGEGERAIGLTRDDLMELLA